MSESWVVNSSPLIILAKAGFLDLLITIPHQVLIPEPVVTEVLMGPAADPARQALESGWGRRVPIGLISEFIRELHLDPGEAAVLTAAQQFGGSTVVLDDSKARQGARGLGLPLIGTLGVILRAKRQNIIPSGADALKKLQSAGLYLNDDLIKAVLPEIGEMWL